jgi:hypothetical protein
VNRSTHAVGAAELAEIRRVSRIIPSILPIALPRLGQYYGEKIGIVCHYVRDVGVAGSNPVTPTIDSRVCFYLSLSPPANSKFRNIQAVASDGSMTQEVISRLGILIDILMFCGLTANG